MEEIPSQGQFEQQDLEDELNQEMVGNTGGKQEFTQDELQQVLKEQIKPRNQLNLGLGASSTADQTDRSKSPVRPHYGGLKTPTKLGKRESPMHLDSGSKSMTRMFS